MSHLSLANGRQCVLMVLLVTPILFVVPTFGNQLDWPGLPELEMVGIEHLRIDGEREENSDNQQTERNHNFTHPTYLDFMLLAHELSSHNGRAISSKFFDAVEKVERKLCSDLRNKSTLIVYDSKRIFKLLSAVIAERADRYEASHSIEAEQGTEKNFENSCLSRVDFELRGDSLSGLKWVGTSERAWEKLTELSRFNLLWHLPDIMEVIGRGSSVGRSDSSFEGRMAQDIESGLMKVVAGIPSSDLPYYLSIGTKGNDLFRSFDQVIYLDDLELEFEKLIFDSYSKIFLSDWNLNQQTFEYAMLKIEKYLQHMSSSTEALMGVLDGLRLSYDSSKAEFRIEDLKAAIKLIGNFPSWFLDEDKKLEKLDNVEQNIRARLVGQNQAFSSVVSTIASGLLIENEKPKPLASLFFVGPTGVGKTFFADQLGREFFEKIPTTIDMTQYTSSSSADEFSDVIANYLKLNPFQVLVFEEIDKAHSDVLNKLHFLLDEGRILDSLQRSIPAHGAIVICTSNDAEAVITNFGPYKDDPDMLENLRRSVFEELKKKYRLSFLNRFQEIQIFYPFSNNEYEQLASYLIKKKSSAYLRRNWSIDLRDSARLYIVENGSSPIFGARPMERLVEKVIDGAITAYSRTFGKHVDNGIELTFVIEFKDGKIEIFEQKDPGKVVKFEITEDFFRTKAKSP